MQSSQRNTAEATNPKSSFVLTSKAPSMYALNFSFSLFLITTALMKMLISYKINKGIETTIWLTTSGGVTIAATTNINTIAYFRYFLKNSGVTNPTLDKK